MTGTPTLPATIDSDTLLAGELPSILVDRALSLHSRNPSSGRTNGGSTGVDEAGEEGEERRVELEREGEGDSLLNGIADDDYARSRSSSKAARHGLPWYKRPSPAWSVFATPSFVFFCEIDFLGNRLLRLFPGTLVSSLLHSSNFVMLTYRWTVDDVASAWNDPSAENRNLHSARLSKYSR